MYFIILSMHVVGSQYWNRVHGHTSEDIRKDIEGLQTMRTLGHNMAYLLKAQKATTDNGIDRPMLEDTVYTDFIH